MTALRQLGAATRALLVLTIVLGLAYPLALTAVGVLFPAQSRGSLVVVDGRVVGSALLGQQTTDPQWFWVRPAAVDDPGAASGGSNLSPTSPELAKAMEKRRAALVAANPDAPGAVPAEALTASGSGLDPHISPAYAAWQAPRVAKARSLPLAAVLRLVDAHTSRALGGFLGTDTVNVTELNVALASLKG